MLIYSTDTILAENRQYSREDFVFFWSHLNRNGGKLSHECFSQWYPCQFQLDDATYSSAEQFMMAEKARLFDDEETLALILKESNPRHIKALGRQVSNFDAATWEKHAADIVVRGNYEKFGQNKDLLQYLLSTNDAILVEASPYDTIWGIGMDAADPRAIDPSQWLGTNLLGFALMQVREIYKRKPINLEKMADGMVSYLQERYPLKEVVYTVSDLVRVVYGWPEMPKSKHHLSTTPIIPLSEEDLSELAILVTEEARAAGYECYAVEDPSGRSVQYSEEDLPLRFVSPQLLAKRQRANYNYNDHVARSERSMTGS